MSDTTPSPREQLATQLAEAVAEALRADLATRDRALLVVSGGSTPLPFFAALAAMELPWERIEVTLADERWVPETDRESNERLARETLLRGAAAAASFTSLTTSDPTPEQGAAEVAARVEALAWPASVVILGMGSDGHTASLFPGTPELDLALSTEEPVVAMRPPGQPRARLTLSADRLHQARRHVLHITGGDKRAVLAEALSGDDIRGLPIRAFLACPLAIYWAP